MNKKHYVIWKGVKPGIYDNWNEAKAQINGRSDAQYMGFPSLEEAQQGFASTYTRALMKRSMERGGKTSSGVTTTSSSRPTPNPSHTSNNTKNNSQSELSNAPKTADFSIYCDGACSPNPGKSGTGMAIYQEQQLIQLWYGLYEVNGTNNSAELNGMLEAFKFAVPLIQQGKTVQVLSDSKYSIDCITKWAKGWKTKGWTRGRNEPIKNLEVIKACFEMYEQLKAQLIIKHVKGHANIEGNELSDRMAVLARSNHTADFVQYTDSIDIKTILAMPSG